MKKVIYLIIMALGMSSTAFAQVSDSLKQEIRSYVNRNFSETRTFNLYWQTSPSYDYTIKQDGTTMEKGEMRNSHTVQFATSIPLLQKSKFSLYAHAQANFYMFEAINNANGGESNYFKNNEEHYSYHKGTINATYRTRIGKKPFILNASISGDGWNEGFEKVSGTFSALLMLKRTPTTSFSVGLYGMTLYSLVPAFPIITYWHQFNPNLSIDITLPSRMYMRYQFHNNHRFSFGVSMESEYYYMQPGMEGLPKTCFYNKSTIRPEIVYEYIINKRFFLIARTGGSAVLQGGIYQTDRKGIDGDPLVKMTNPMTPFFNLGFSYNIFK